MSKEIITGWVWRIKFKHPSGQWYFWIINAAHLPFPDDAVHTFHEQYPQYIDCKVSGIYKEHTKFKATEFGVLDND